ncbi:hypothetical protein BDV09DRAFT_52799 [Aspergillus tetrazonus]
MHSSDRWMVVPERGGRRPAGRDRGCRKSQFGDAREGNQCRYGWRLEKELPRATATNKSRRLARGEPLTSTNITRGQGRGRTRLASKHRNQWKAMQATADNRQLSTQICKTGLGEMEDVAGERKGRESSQLLLLSTLDLSTTLVYGRLDRTADKRAKRSN